MLLLGARFDRLGSWRWNLAKTGSVKHWEQFANTPWYAAVDHATSFFGGNLGGMCWKSRFRGEESRTVEVEPVLQEMVIFVDGG